MVKNKTNLSTPKRPCPRCDYDLSGEVDSWTTHCPLEGRCPECGLDYQWRNVLNPRLTVPKWSFEHAPARPWPLIKTYVLTLLMTLRPWRFWREMQTVHPINSFRLLELQLAAVICFHISLGVIGFNGVMWSVVGVASSNPIFIHALRVFVFAWDSNLGAIDARGFLLIFLRLEAVAILYAAFVAMLCYLVKGELLRCQRRRAAARAMAYLSVGLWSFLAVGLFAAWIVDLLLSILFGLAGIGMVVGLLMIGGLPLWAFVNALFALHCQDIVNLRDAPSPTPPP